MLGERQSAADLKTLGLVNRVVPADQMRSTAMALAAEVATRSAGATARLKRVLASGLGPKIEKALVAEGKAANACFADPDTAQRIEMFAKERL